MNQCIQDYQYISTLFSFIVAITAIITSIILIIQFLKTKKSIMGNTMMHISNNHRDLFLAIINDKSLAKIIKPNKEYEDVKWEYILTILINHASTIYEQYKLRNIRKEFWEATFNDMKEMFNNKAIKNRWDKIKFYHSKDFRLFVDKELIRSSSSGN